MGLIRCKAKYAYGPVGRKNMAPGAEVEVPPDADLEYEVEVMDIYPGFNPKDDEIRVKITEAR